MWWLGVGGGTVGRGGIPRGEGGRQKFGELGFFFKTSPFSSQHFIQLSRLSEFPELFPAIPTEERGKWAQFRHSRCCKAMPWSKAVKSLTRDGRPCRASPAHPQLNQQNLSKSGSSSLDGGCAAEGPGQWINSPLAVQNFFFIWKNYACCFSD